MNREIYALKEISKIINKVYNINICLCCNNYMIVATNDFMKTRNFIAYYTTIKNQINDIVICNIDVTQYTIAEIDYIYDIIKLIETY